MGNDTEVRRTCLFTVRLWLEPLDGSRVVIRGEVRHVLSGERRSVRDWAALEAFFIEKLSDTSHLDKSQDADNTFGESDS